MRTKCFDIFLCISIFILAIALSLTACEILARISHLSKTYSSYPHMVNENLSVKYFPKKNSYGWRDREFTKTKEINAYRIACIGDSVTEGYRVAIENTFSKVLENNLREAGYDTEVMNLGKAGNASSHNLSAVKVAVKFDTDLIIYQFGLNDIAGLEHVEPGSIIDTSLARDKRLVKNKKFDIKPLLRKSIFYLALAERYNYIKLRLGCRTWAFDEWKVTDLMWTEDFTRIKKAFDNIQMHTEICMIYIPYDYEVYSIREETLISSEKISSFCKDNGYHFLDFTRIFKDQRYRYKFFLDDCHLSDDGHRIVARHLADFIIDRIKVYRVR